MRATIFEWRSDGKDDFTELRAGFQISVGSYGFGKRENAVDDWFQSARSDKLHYRVQLGFCAHVGAESESWRLKRNLRSTLAS